MIVVGTHLDLWDNQPSHRSTLEEAFTKKFLELYIDCDTRQRRTYPKIMEKLFLLDTYNREHINRLRDTVYDFALEYQVSGRTSELLLIIMYTNDSKYFRQEELYSSTGRASASLLCVP